jgi:hypothetical protein
MNPSSLFRIRQLAPWVIVLLSAIVAVAAYLQALHYPFVSDDGVYVTGNTKLAALHLSELWRLFIEPYNRYEFLPLRDLSYWFDLVHNIVLYLLCLPLVYAATLGLLRYFRPAYGADGHLIAAVVTALFALHPAHVEAVVWISGRKDLLSGLFSMLALYFAIYAKREQGLSPYCATAALLALLAAMLSKATAVAIAPVIALLWIIFWRDIPKRHHRRTQLLWPIASLILAMGLALIFSAKSTVKVPMYFGSEAISRALAILGWLGRLAVSPENRHFIYPVFEDAKLPAMIALGAFILIVALTGVIKMQYKWKLEVFNLLVFLLLCLPYTQLIPFQTISLVSDRFLFIAVWMTILLIVALAWRLKPVLCAAVLLIISFAWGYQTVERPSDWHGEALLDADLSAYPGHYQPAFHKIRNQLGLGLYNDAITTATSITVPEFRNIMMSMIQAAYAVNTATAKPDKALTLLQNFERALNHSPAEAKWNLPMRYVSDDCKNILALKGTRLAQQFPDDALVRYKAGLWKLNVYSYNDAVTHLRAATESQRLPESVRGEAFKSLGDALLGSGHVAEAEAPLHTALEQSPPDLHAYCSLAEVYKQSRRFDEATRAKMNCPDAN